MKPREYVRKKVTFTFANGAVGADLIQSEDLYIEGEIIQILQDNHANTNARTAQLTLEDVDSYEIWDGTAKAHNAIHNFEFGVSIRRIMKEKNTLKCTISGDPGATGYEINVIIYVDGFDI